MFSTGAVETINFILALGTVLLQIAIVVVAACYILSRSLRAVIVRQAGRYGMQLALTIAVISTAMSLFYSNILGFTPCTLCWWQRIFVYPQVVLLGLGLWRKERTIIDYSLILLGLGLIISVYQVYLQVGGAALGSCGVGSVSCTQLYVYEFGYVTIPVMALTSYIAMIIALLLAKQATKS